jgi:glycopeptide antibiotics resistance protein
MIGISYGSVMVGITILWILVRGIVCLRQRKFSLKRELQLLLVYICVVVVTRFTFFPFSKVNGQVQPLLFDMATAWPFRINLVPFVNLLDYPSKKEILINVIGNGALCIPTGIVTPLLYPHLNSFKKTVMTGFLISLTIEIIQLPFAVRCSDVDDLILNTLGCVIGYGFLSLVRALRRK